MNKRQSPREIKPQKSARSLRSGWSVRSRFWKSKTGRLESKQKQTSEFADIPITSKHTNFRIDLTGKISPQIQKYLAEDTVLSNSKLYEIANNGVPISALDQFTEDISMMVANKVLPRKTLEDAINKPDGKLSARNSEKLIRVLRLKHKAKEALGEESAIRWMEKPNKNFNGLSAVEMAKSESGARAVEQFLGQLAHGFNA